MNFLGSGNLKKSINLKYTFDLLEQYLTYIEAIRGSAPSTINEYRYDLGCFSILNNIGILSTPILN